MPGGSVPEGPTTWPWHRASNAVIDSLTHEDKGEPYEANHSLARSPDRLFLAGLALGRRRLRWRWHDDAASAASACPKQGRQGTVDQDCAQESGSPRRALPCL